MCICLYFLSENNHHFHRERSSDDPGTCEHAQKLFCGLIPTAEFAIYNLVIAQHRASLVFQAYLESSELWEYISKMVNHRFVITAWILVHLHLTLSVPLATFGDR